MEDELRRITLLLQGISNEEKVAGIMLSTKILEMNILGSEKTKIFLKEALSLISPGFFINLIATKDKKRLYRRVGMDFLAASIQWGFSSNFQSSTSRLLDILFLSLDKNTDTPNRICNTEAAAGASSSENTVTASELELEKESDEKFTLSVLFTLKLIAVESSKEILDIILEYVLTNVGKATTQIPVFLFPSLLEFIIDIIEIKALSNNKISNEKQGTVFLSVESAELLRMIIVKGFHGGAPEIIRDSSLLCCLHLLSSHSVINPNWSVETVHTTSDTKVKQEEPSKIGKFAMLLLSIVGIEMHLLLEEALALFKEPQGELHMDSEGDNRDPSVQRRKNYNNAKVDPKGEYVSIRIIRLKKLLPSCLSIMTAALHLLVGIDEIEENEENGENADIEEPYWSILSSTAMLHIKQSIQNIFQKVFDFLKEVSDISQRTMFNVFKDINNKNSEISRNINKITKIKEYAENILINYKNDSLLVNIIQQSTAALCLWVLEDEDLRDPFIRHLPFILPWSVVTLYLTNDDTDDIISNSKNDNIESKKFEKIEEIEGKEIWKALQSTSWTVLSFNNITTATSISTDEFKENEEEEGSKNQENVGDVLHYLLPCLASISYTLTEKDILADRLCTLDSGCLFTRLINLVLLTAKNVNYLQSKCKNNILENANKISKISETQENSASNLLNLADTICAAFDLLSSLFSWKINDICLLIKGESETEALTAIYTLTDLTFPYIPIIGKYSMSKSKRSIADRHTERLADILAVASGVLSENYSNSNSSDNEMINRIDSSICNLVQTLSAISIE